MQLYLLE